MGFFIAWLHEAAADPNIVEPNAMAFGTTSEHGAPSVRMVLVKNVEPQRAAVRIFTGLSSRKAHELSATGRAAGTLWWPGREQQVRFVGRIEPAPRDETAAYYATRPEGSRIGAAVSRQSLPVRGREELDQRYDAAVAQAAVGTQLPEHWGGFDLLADEIEFWQGRVSRLHDRVVFHRLNGDGVFSSSDLDHDLGEALRQVGTVVCDPHGTSWLRARLEP